MRATKRAFVCEEKTSLRLYAMPAENDSIDLKMKSHDKVSWDDRLTNEFLLDNAGLMTNSAVFSGKTPHSRLRDLLLLLKGKLKNDAFFCSKINRYLSLYLLL
jgi:hypothetical protein